MAASIFVSEAGTTLLPAEIRLVEAVARDCGRVTLLADSYAQGEVIRRNLADAGVGVAVDVLTPSAWLEGLWRLLGDGTRLAGPTERLLLAAHVLGGLAGEDGRGAEPLKDNPGSVRMLADMARTCLPFALGADGRTHGGLSRAEERCVAALGVYEHVLRDRGLVEPAAAAMALAGSLGGGLPPIARGVVVRGVTDLPEYLLRLLEVIAREGRVAFLYNDCQAPLAQALASRFGVGVEPLAGDGPVLPGLTFAEVAGPTARAASYARLVLDRMGGAGVTPLAVPCGCEVADAGSAPGVEPGSIADGGLPFAVAAPNPIALFRELAPRLASRGLTVTAESFVPFGETRAGQMFFTLMDFVERLDDPETGSWWPAPEVVDWLRSPFSGAGSTPFVALSLDTFLRKTRAMTKDGLLAELESRQSRQANRERDFAQERGGAPRPVVFKQVIDAIAGKRYARALALMRDACSAAGPGAFGGEGLAAQQAEFSALQHAIDLFETARALSVGPDRAMVALRASGTFASIASVPDGEGRGDARAADVLIVPLDTLASREAASVAGVLIADASAEAYPLAERETVSSVLAGKLGCTGLRLAPVGRQRDRFHRALQAAHGASALAYVTRDDAAEELYPALAYAELAERPGAGTRACGLPGEGELFANLDPALGAGSSVDDALRLPEHVLPEELRRYVLLPNRCFNVRVAPRKLSASQVENYLACPYRWFVNSRVVTHRLDVEFGPIERGNFAHDVMQRFYERLAECGLDRVRPETVEACLEQMDIAFDEVRADHELGKYTHGKYAVEKRPRQVRGGLVAIDEIERMRLDAMRSQFHEVVRHDADMMPIFTPVRLEYSFDRQNVTYAGRPLGGRIDRIDVAPDAGSGKRFVVIDYKTGANVNDMACPDPTMMLEEGERLAEDWLPGRDRDKAPKVQTLMYATALERMTGGSAQGAVYYGLRGPSVAGAVSSALTECEPSAFPADKVSAFPGVKGRTRAKRDGDMEMPELLERVERAIAREFDALEAGAIAPRPTSDSCTFCPLTMCEKRR